MRWLSTQTTWTRTLSLITPLECPQIQVNLSELIHLPNETRLILYVDLVVGIILHYVTHEVCSDVVWILCYRFLKLAILLPWWKDALSIICKCTLKYTIQIPLKFNIIKIIAHKQSSVFYAGAVPQYELMTLHLLVLYLLVVQTLLGSF